MNRDRVLVIVQRVGWGLIVGLCIIVALLWTRVERQVALNKADIEMLKAYSDAQDRRVREEAKDERAKLENRWGQHLMPLLREHHRLLESIPEVREPIPPLPAWLKE